jgi:hypothetical protein
MASGIAQDTAATKKKPSKAAAVAKKLADTAATAAAGAGVQSLLGKKAAGGVANALGVGGVLSPCGTPTASAGAAIVGVAKGVAKKATDTTAPTPTPCPQGVVMPGMPAGVPGMPGGIPGMPGGNAAAAMAAGAAMSGAGAAGPNPMAGMGAIAAMTPVGLAASAAPGAIKGIKGLMGGKPQDKVAMLRELGKGKLELKDVKFIEGTAELEAGYEPSLAALGEAIGLAEGTYLLHVAAEAGEKGSAPDTALARKRIEKVWAAILVNGVSDQRLIAAQVLPPALQEGRKPPKQGKARVELIRLPDKS